MGDADFSVEYPKWLVEAVGMMTMKEKSGELIGFVEEVKQETDKVRSMLVAPPSELDEMYKSLHNELEDLKRVAGQLAEVDNEEDQRLLVKFIMEELANQQIAEDRRVFGGVVESARQVVKEKQQQPVVQRNKELGVWARLPSPEEPVKLKPVQLRREVRRRPSSRVEKEPVVRFEEEPVLHFETLYWFLGGDGALTEEFFQILQEPPEEGRKEREEEFYRRVMEKNVVVKGVVVPTVPVIPAPEVRNELQRGVQKLPSPAELETIGAQLRTMQKQQAMQKQSAVQKPRARQWDDREGGEPWTRFREEGMSQMISVGMDNMAEELKPPPSTTEVEQQQQQSFVTVSTPLSVKLPF